MVIGGSVFRNCCRVVEDVEGPPDIAAAKASKSELANDSSLPAGGPGFIMRPRLDSAVDVELAS